MVLAQSRKLDISPTDLRDASMSALSDASCGAAPMSVIPGIHRRQNPSFVPKSRYGLNVISIQSVQHRDDVLPAVLQIRRDPVCKCQLRTHKDRVGLAVFVF
jgi:hypothetical protein